MKNTTALKIVFTLIISLQSITTFAWGPVGHSIVARVAMSLLSAEVKQNVQTYLGNISMNHAANWMDSMRSNSDYDFMKPWHYIDFPKGNRYNSTNDENIVNRLILTISELKHKKTLCSDQVRIDLLILFHLMGDLHQPLHNAYDDDFGGNKVAVQYDTIKTNLHHFWDENIIDLEHISYETVLKNYNSSNLQGFDSLKHKSVSFWMLESRSFLPSVYDYPGFEPNKKYMVRSKEIIERQLLVAGIRLAGLLEKLFYTPAPVVNTKELNAKYKNGIEASEAINHVGENVTVCSRVYGIKKTDKICLINLGAQFPNSTLTVVIFASDFEKFNSKMDELYTDKNICVKGTVEVRNRKAQIIVTRPEDIEIK